MGNKPDDGNRAARGKNPINDLYRLSNIKRWLIVETSREQSVAEHSYNVTILAMRVASVLNLPVGRIVFRALLHDAEECWTGDIPSPIKDGPVLEKETLSLMMGDLYKLDDDHHLIYNVVKLCDVAEAIKFLKIYGVGKHAKSVELDLTTELADRIDRLIDEYPKIVWQPAVNEFHFYFKGLETHIDDYV